MSAFAWFGPLALASFLVMFFCWLRPAKEELPKCPLQFHDIWLSVLLVFLLACPAWAVNVKDYGAKGDGQTDDSAAIQLAVDAAPPGDLVQLFGVHLISNPVYIRKRLVVAGPAEVREMTRLSVMLDVAGSPASGSVVRDLRLVGSENASTFIGGPTAMFSGMRIAGIDGVVVERCFVSGKTYGIRFDNATRCRVSNCTVEGFLSVPTLNSNYHSAVLIDRGKAVQVRGLNAANIGSAVLLGHETQYPIVESVYAENCQDNGVYLSSGIGGRVRDVTVVGVKGSGVKCRGSLHSVQGCVIRGALTGVALTGSGTTLDAQGANGFGSSVIGCTLEGCTYGIHVGKQDGYFLRDVRGRDNFFLNVTTPVRVDGGLRIQIEE